MKNNVFLKYLDAVQSIINCHEFINYKKAFNEVYANQRYSFKIPADLKPITQIKKDLDVHIMDGPMEKMDL